MERRTKVWIVTLGVLLVAALFSTVFFKLKLDAADDKVIASQQLQESMSAEMAEKDAQLEEAEAKSKAEIDSLETEVAELEAAGAEKDEYIASLEAEKTAAEDEAALVEENAKLRSELDAATARVEELESELSDALAASVGTDDGDDALEAALSEVESLKAQLAEVEGQLAQAKADCETLTAELDAVNARADELEKALAGQTGENASGQDGEQATADSRIAELEQQLSDALSAQADVEDQRAAAVSELDAVKAELDAYKAAYAAGDGEKYASAEMDDCVNVQADGVTAAYAFMNNSASGNSVIFELVLDDEVLYKSSEIVPGEELGEFTLARRLEAGEYEAQAVMSTIGADGEVSSNLMLPVIVVVAE